MRLAVPPRRAHRRRAGHAWLRGKEKVRLGQRHARKEPAVAVRPMAREEEHEEWVAGLQGPGVSEMGREKDGEVGT